MGAVGTCYDNAVAETFFATLTKERLLHYPPANGWGTRAQLRSAIFEYIEGFYNRGGNSPAPRTGEHYLDLARRDQARRARFLRRMPPGRGRGC
jgi:hypothetical protein